MIPADQGSDRDSWLVFHENKLVVRLDNGGVLHAPGSLPVRPGGSPHVVEEGPAGRVLTVRLEAGEIPGEGFGLRGLRDLLLEAPADEFRLASTALQILEWERLHRYCSHCGSPTMPHPRGERAKVCTACGYAQYPRIQPCVIVAITRDDHILLARAQRYTLPMYSLLAGFVEVGETLEEAVHREVFEESGLRVRNLRYFGSQSWPFPSNLMLAFHAEWESGDIRLQEEELLDGRFFHYRDLPMIPPAGSISHRLIMSAVDELAARYGG